MDRKRTVRYGRRQGEGSDQSRAIRVRTGPLLDTANTRRVGGPPNSVRQLLIRSGKRAVRKRTNASSGIPSAGDTGESGSSYLLPRARRHAGGASAAISSH